MRNLSTILCITIAMLLGSIGMSWSANFQKGRNAASSGDFQTALRELEPLAKQGHSNAQVILGIMYEFGDGVPQDYKIAEKWYKLAANKGSSLAQYNLGNLYRSGLGVAKSYNIAMNWYLLSAKQGFAQSQINLGRMYEMGMAYHRTISLQ